MARWRIENVTHALAGILVAHLATDVAERRSSAASADAWARTRRAAVVVSALANNVPDVDLVYSWITEGPLGYLLHHRGHTHTLPVAMALGLMVASAALRIAKLEVGRTLIVLLGLLGPLIHLAMDALNIYGVHPFWPLESRWYYGDRMFILEPLFWLTALPAAFVRSTSSVFRGAAIVLFGLILVAPWLVPASFVPLPIRFALLAVAAASLVLARRRPPRWNVRFATVAWLIVIGAFSAARQRAEQLTMVALYEEMPGAIIEDIALSPMPSNPLCFSVFLTAVPAPDEDRFLVRRGVVHVAEAALRCPAEEVRGTAPLDAVEARGPVEWTGEVGLSRADLRALAERCDVAAALQFYRVPFWVADAETVTFGDLRFDRSPGADFPEVTFPREAPTESGCPRFVTAWTPPRARMLQPP